VPSRRPRRSVLGCRHVQHCEAPHRRHRQTGLHDVDALAAEGGESAPATAGPPTVENSRPVPDHEIALVRSSGGTVCGRALSWPATETRGPRRSERAPHRSPARRAVRRARPGRSRGAPPPSASTPRCRGGCDGRPCSRRQT
jgi:hypothetical protein